MALSRRNNSSGRNSKKKLEPKRNNLRIVFSSTIATNPKMLCSKVRIMTVRFLSYLALKRTQELENLRYEKDVQLKKDSYEREIKSLEDNFKKQIENERAKKLDLEKAIELELRKHEETMRQIN
jgi:hypothetical protein